MLEIKQVSVIGDGLGKRMYPYDGAFTHKKEQNNMCYHGVGYGL